MKNINKLLLFVAVIFMNTLSSCTSMAQRGALSDAEEAYSVGDCHRTLKDLAWAENSGPLSEKQQTYSVFNIG